MAPVAHPEIGMQAHHFVSLRACLVEHADMRVIGREHASPLRRVFHAKNGADNHLGPPHRVIGIGQIP